jgi:hypothetical protein
MVSKSTVLAVVLSGLTLLSGGLARAEQPNQPGNNSNVKSNTSQPTAKKSSGVQAQDSPAKSKPAAKKASSKSSKSKGGSKTPKPQPSKRVEV